MNFFLIFKEKNNQHTHIFNEAIYNSTQHPNNERLTVIAEHDKRMTHVLSCFSVSLILADIFHQIGGTDTYQFSL